MNFDARKIMADSRIFLSYLGIKGVKYKEAANNLIQAISSGYLEVTVLHEDLVTCLYFLPKEQCLALHSLLNNLKVTVFSFKEPLCAEFNEHFIAQIGLLKLNDPRNTFVLAAFLAFNQTSTFSEEFDAFVTFSPQDFHDQDNGVKSVIDLLDDLSNDLHNKRESLKRKLTSKNTKVSFCPARTNAAIRGRENLREDPLFKDDWSFILAGETAHSIINELSINVERPYVVVRTRYIDDLIKSLSEDIKQIIIIGAGMDTRSFRLKFTSGTVVFELDQKELLDDKERKLNLFRATSNCRRHVIPVDLTQCNWIKSLQSKGYDMSKPSLVIMEGVQMYLTETQLKDLLRYISAFTSNGSIMFMDIINNRALINSESSRKWKSGVDVPEPLFTETGWIPKIKQPGDPGASYGRYKPLPPREENLDIERVFFCIAEKVSQPLISGLEYFTSDTVKVKTVKDA